MAITKATNSGLVGIKYNNVSADNYYMEPIASQLLSSTASTITFNNIPQGYKHLQLRFIAQSNYNYPVDDAYVRFNSDSGSNYSSHALMGNGGSAYSGSTTSQTSSQIAYGTVGTTSGNQTTASWGAFVVDILDYQNSNKFKTVRCLSGNDCNGTGLASLGGRVGLTSGLWMNAAPIASIEIICAQGARSFQINSRFSLYGIRG